MTDSCFRNFGRSLLISIGFLCSFTSIAHAVDGAENPTCMREGRDAYKSGDLSSAVRAWQDGHNQGHLECTYYLGILYLQGFGLEQNVEAGIELIEKAGQGGVVEAQKQMAKFYHSGIDVPQDPAKSFDWTMKAAESGDVDSMISVADDYLAGTKIVPKNPEKAAHWYEIAAQKGSAQAIYMVGNLHARGEGKEQDWDKAIFLWTKASELGYEPATRKLQSLKK